MIANTATTAVATRAAVIATTVAVGAQRIAARHQADGRAVSGRVPGVLAAPGQAHPRRARRSHAYDDTDEHQVEEHLNADHDASGIGAGRDVTEPNGGEDGETVARSGAWIAASAAEPPWFSRI